MLYTKRISVVLASYNGEKYISEQITSLLKNLSQNDELIISDDNSTDSTIEIIQSVKDSRVKLISTGSHLGYQKNFERAISVAQGEIIMFSDQDDICLPARISSTLLSLEDKSVVAGDATVVDANLNITSKSYFSFREIQSFSPLAIYLKPRIVGATMAAKRDFINYALPFPDGVPHDQWLSLLAATYNQLIVHPESFILYRRHDNVVTSWEKSRRRKFHIILLERFKLLCFFLKKILNKRIFGLK